MANITQSQVTQALNASTQLVQAALQLQSYAESVNNLFQNNFMINLPFGTIQLPIPTANQTDVIDISRYNTLKQNLVTIFNTLP